MCDAGEWKGVIKNRVGEKVLSANLEVIRKFKCLTLAHTPVLICRLFPACNEYRRPNILKYLHDQQLPKNDTVTMSVTLTADPLPDIQWLHNDKDCTTDTFIKVSHEVKELEHSLKEVTYTMTIPQGECEDHFKKDFQ
jgi:Immunoglobulin I-set domain